MATGRTSSGSELTAGQAAYVLERLLKERRVSMGDINGYLSEMNREIGELEQRLQRLRDAQSGSSGGSQQAQTQTADSPARRRRGRRPGRPAASAQTGASATETASRGGKRKGRKASAITSEQLASRQLQGRYLSLVRRFPESRRGIYAKIARDRGRESAIKAMQDALGK